MAVTDMTAQHFSVQSKMAVDLSTSARVIRDSEQNQFNKVSLTNPNIFF